MTVSPPPAPIRVLLVEDQPRLRAGLAQLVDDTPWLRLCGSCGSMEEALRLLPDARPDVAMVDLGLPGMSGIEGTRVLRERSPATQVLILTVHDDDAHVFEAICAGAAGYLLKDTPPPALAAAVRELASGGAPMSPSIARRVVTMFHRVAPPVPDQRLSPRETEVLDLLAQGHSYKTAAAALALGIDTVRFHVRHIYDKLHVHSKSAAVRAALRQGLIR